MRLLMGTTVVAGLGELWSVGVGRGGIVMDCLSYI